ncbi:MAG: patatin-like phospholipase family protein [Emticicia sp.]|uniref:patatin-like phospholipase family protein n=1 Tax=Emticicia sp. TaxID=1930953 RepID=UPI003BA7BFF9
MKTYPYKNLVFKGGGVKGIAYVGALKALETANILPQITRFAGTSAGAITAALAACRISSDALNTFLSTTNYNNFKDKGGVFNFLNDLANHFGAYEGDYFLDDWFKVFLSKQGVDPEITFKGVNDKFGTTLKVFSTDLNLQQVQVFSFETTPNVKIAEAVRASMSIPMFFRAWQFPDGDPNDHIYVDGGVMYNYPVDTFDSVDSPEATLGFFLTDLNPDDHKPNDLAFGISHLELYIKSVFESLMNSQDVMVNENEFDESRTVRVDDLGISATDFGITQDQAKQLYDSGYKATNDFLKAKNI